MTILGFVLQGDPDLQARLVNSTIAEFPIIGSQLRENVHSLKGSGVGLAADGAPVYAWTYEEAHVWTTNSQPLVARALSRLTAPQVAPRVRTPR